MAWWWPFRRRKAPLERWTDDYVDWLEDFQKLMSRFPDHTVLEGVRLSDSDARTLDQITDLYGEHARELLEQMVLKGAQLAYRKQLRDGAQ